MKYETLETIQFPVSLKDLDQSLAELNTLSQCGMLDGQDIDSDMLDQLINSNEE